MDNLQQFLAATPCVNSSESSVVALAQSLVKPGQSDIEMAIDLYHFVRDEIPYNPYTADTTVESLKASSTLSAGEGWCVSKAVLLAALCRASGIPARLGFADVVNHLSTEKLRQSMKTDVFYYHGYCSIFLEGKWVKATPAFNLSLCEKFKLVPLDFNGREDSLYHPFDQAGNRHMEYVNERGEFADVPIADMQAVFAEFYPDFAGIEENDESDITHQWQSEVLAETS